MRRRSLLSLLMVFAVVVLSHGGGCREKDTAGVGKAVVVRVGYRPRAMLDVTPVVVEQRGLQATGVKVELVPLSSPQDGFAKAAAGEVDVLVGLPLEAILGNVGADPSHPAFKIYSVQADAIDLGWAAIVAGKNTTANSVRDLGGVTVTSLPTDQAEYLLRRILVSAGVSKDEVKTTRYSMSNPLAQLAAGEAGALFGPDPAVALAVADGYRVIERGTLSRYLAHGKPFPVSASVVTTQFAERNPAALQAWLKLVADAKLVVSSKPEEVREYFGKTQYGGLSSNVRQHLVFPLMSEPTPELNETTNALLSELHRDGLLKAELRIEWFLLK